MAGEFSRRDLMAGVQALAFAQAAAAQSPLLPPVLETSRTASITMPFSAAFSMS